MPKKMLIDATHAEETRVVVVDGNKVEEFDFESENKRQLAGNIYLAKVTRVEPSLQAAFVDYGGNRHGFLAFSEIHPDYYQIPVADREALLEEERAYAESLKARDEEDDKPKKTRSRSRSRTRKKTDEAAVADGSAEGVSEATETDDAAAVQSESGADEISGMETIDLTSDAEENGAEEAVADAEVVEAPEAAEEAPAEIAEADESAADESAPEPEVVAEVEVSEDAAAAKDDDAKGDDAKGDEDKGPKTIAASTEGEDAKISMDPETGEETEVEAEAPVKAEAEAEAQPADEAVVEADVSEETAEAPEDAAPAEETAETTAEETADASAQETSTEEADAGSDESSDEEDDGKRTRKRRSRSRSKRSNAAEKDESIESVADDDDSEDIRPPRKPRARRYKIQEVVKVRQIMLVQVVKEERGNKGAALTTYLSLAGRYCVLMPNTARGGGISRKITNAPDRKKLKEIATEIDVPTGAGLIVRTAGAKRTKSEIKRDYEYLQRMWEQIRELTLKSIAPAKIYEEGDLIKRSIRDLYSREIDEVLVEGERGYRIAKDFMKMIMPSHAKNVKQYQETLPLFARYQVETYLGGMFNPTVQLKSGGYIVIGVTEALVAIDVNSGRATKEGSIEETATKTNLEAAEEVARQLRLRDLAGLIVIDFIDMDERKNNAAVEKRMKDKLKTDRARIQVGRISGFGLMEMSRQRLRPGMIEATTQPCAHCHGTGLIRSDDNLALSILRQIEEEGTRGRSREVLVKAPVSIANYLMNAKREHVAQIEARYGLSVRIESDPHLISPDFSIEKFKTATRVVVEAMPVVSVDTSIMDEIDSAVDVVEGEAVEVTNDEAAPEAGPEAGDEENKPKKRRRRRRRRKSTGTGENGEAGDTDASAADGADNADASGDETPSDESEAQTTEDGAEQSEAEEKPKKTRSRSRSRSRPRSKKVTDDTVSEADQTPAEPVEGEVEAVAEAPAEASAEPAAPVAEETVVTETRVEDAPQAEDAVAAEPVLETATAEVEVVAAVQEPVAVPEPAAPPKPKRRGWWSR
ncbi:Rne/Rng family ribonuclease [Shimia sp. SK013]|uniref:Rne/Rng family ribonuclease n=1 Tax=Shimia sp. SK013 TaxID=1389006 RepID=UPI0006B55E7F